MCLSLILNFTAFDIHLNMFAEKLTQNFRASQGGLKCPLILHPMFIASCYPMQMDKQIQVMRELELLKHKYLHLNIKIM